jgi:hypothetical protein
MSKIHDFVVKHIVADVPGALSACLDCGFVQCLSKKWETCPNRLAREAALLAMHAAAAKAGEPWDNATAPKAKEPPFDPTAPWPVHR